MPAESAGGTAATACSSWWLVESQWGGTQAEPACPCRGGPRRRAPRATRQRGEAATVLDAEYVLPGRIGQHVLEHQGVDVDQGGLQDPQAGDGELALVAAVGGQLPALAVQDDRLAGVVGLQHVEALTDLPLQVPVAEVSGDEDGLLRAAYLHHLLVGRVGRRPGAAPQDRLGGGGPEPDRGGVADHHGVL